MNVHLLSDTPRGTSAYAKITRNLAMGLAERGHNITITGFIAGYENFHGIDVLPLSTPFTHPQVQFSNNLKESKAEVLICIHEAHNEYAVYSQMFSPTLFWVPVEGEGLPEHMSRALASPSIAKVTAMSNAGRKELGTAGIESSAVYPGYDPAIFKPSTERICKYSMDIYQQRQDARTLAKRGCFECDGKRECPHFEVEKIKINLNGEFTGSISSVARIKDNLGAEFVIGCVAQNKGLRKRIERLIEAFSLMENKDSLLHLHALPVSLQGLNLFETVKKFNVNDRVIFSYSDNPVHGISDHGMNTLYNYFDIHATASSFEGFCLPVLESASIGKAQVAPRCGTFLELLGENEERGLLASIAATALDPDMHTRSLVDVKNLAGKMDTLYEDKSLRKKQGDAGAQWAKQFTWDKVVSQWEQLLDVEEVKGCKVDTPCRTPI